MAHIEQFQFIQSVREKYIKNFDSCKVLEIGSLNINGSVRRFFSNCIYTGIDVGPGRDVDIVCEGQNYDAPDCSFETVISCECFEHNPYWVETFSNMVRMCKPGGLIIMTCATTNRPEHGTTRTNKFESPLTIEKGWDYYKNVAVLDFEREFNMPNVFSTYCFRTERGNQDLYFYGVKK